VVAAPVVAGEVGVEVPVGPVAGESLSPPVQAAPRRARRAARVRLRRATAATP